MGGNALLHLDLHGSITRINIVEQFLAGLTGVRFYFIIQIFRNMDKLLCTQTKIIQARKLIVRVHLSDELFEFLGIPQQYCSEIKVIPQRTKLIVNDRRLHNAFVNFVEMVRIHHRSTGHFHDLHHSFLT